MRLWLLVACVLAAGACAPSSVSAPVPARRGEGGAVGVRVSAPVPGRDARIVQSVARSILEQVNEARRRAGRQVLLPDAALERAAREYSRELAARELLDHVSPTPGRHTFMQRLAAEGAHPRFAGENLALLTETPTGVAPRVVRLWLDSPGHRANLLDPRYTRTGIGAWQGANGVWYVTEEYGSGT